MKGKHLKPVLAWLMALQIVIVQTVSVSAIELQYSQPTVITIAWPGEGKDASPNIQAAIVRAKALDRPVTLAFEPGKQYEVWPETAYHNMNYYISNAATKSENSNGERWSAIFLKDMADVTIEGNGALLLTHGVMTPLLIDNSQNITFQNLHVDWARPTMSEFTILENGSTFAKIKVNESSLYQIEGNRVRWLSEKKPDGTYYWTLTGGLCVKYDPVADTARGSSFTWGNSIIDEGGGILRLEYGRNPGLTVGQTYQFRSGSRDQVGSFIHKSKNVHFENMGFHYMHGLGIVGQYTENLSFNNLDCTPREETGRTCASSADFVQISGCKGLVSITNSKFKGSHDDVFNIHGTHLRVTKKDESKNQITVRFMQERSWGFQAFDVDDEIEFIAPDTMLPYAKNKVKSFNRLNDYEIELVLENPLPNNITLNSDVVENITNTPDVVVKGNYASAVTTRGILCTTRGKVLIEDNTFYKMGMSGVLLEDDVRQWFESGLIKDMTIKNNKFIECGGPVIFSNPQTSVFDPNKTVHSNITITGNSFTGNAQIRAISTKNLLIEGNEFKNGGNVSLSACNGFEIKDNNIGLNSVSAENSLNDASLSSIQLNPVTVELPVGKKMQLELKAIGKTGMPAKLPDNALTYVSSAHNIASVAPDGTITAVAQGTADITVTATAYGNALSKTASVTVTSDVYIAASSLQLSPVKTFTGSSLQLNSTVEPTSAQSDLQWSIKKLSGVGSANINKGLVTATSSGRFLVTAFSQNNPEISDSVMVTVINNADSSGEWSIVRENKANWSITENNAFSLVTENGAIWAKTDNVKNIITRNVDTNDFELVTKMNYKPSADYAEAGIILYVDDSNYVMLTRKQHSGYGGYIFSMITEINGNPAESPAQNIVADNVSSNDVYLKIRKSGDNYSGYYSADGSVWIPVWENRNLSFSVTPKAGVIGYGSGGTARYDYLEIGSNRYTFEKMLPAMTFKNSILTEAIPAVLQVKKGTSWDKLALPETVSLTWNDTYKDNAAVQWKQGNYNGDIIGKYTLMGTLDDVSSENLNQINITAEVFVVADKTALNEIIRRAENKEKDLYTSDSWSLFQTALNEAKIIALNTDVTIGQNLVDEQVQKLSTAISGLLLKADVDQILEQAAAAVQTAVNAITATNQTSADSILALAHAAISNKEIKASWSKNAVITAATKESAGSIIGTLALTLNENSNEVAVNLIIQKLSETDPEVQTLEQAVTAVQTAINGITATNETTAGRILALAQAAISNKEIKAAWSKDAVITAATKESAGSIIGTLALTLNESTNEVAVNLTIPKLDESDPEVQTLEQAVTAVQTAVNAITATNETTADSILAIAQAAISNKEIKATWSKELVITAATKESAGSIIGTLGLTLNENSNEVAVNLTIPKLDESDPEVQTLEQAVTAVQTAVNAIAATNETTADSILALAQAAISNKEIKATWSKELVITAATKESAGSIIGTLGLALNENSNQVAVNLTIPKLGEISPEKPSSDNSPAPKPRKHIEPNMVSSSGIREKLASSSKGIDISVRSDYNVATGFLNELMKNKDKSVTLNGDWYSWTFDGKDIENNMPSVIWFDTQISTDSPNSEAIDKLAGEADTTNLHFNYEGQLPGKTTIRVALEEYAGKKVYVYYYNPVKGRLELIQADVKADEDGWIEFSITHCSDYVVSSKAVKGAVKVTKPAPISEDTPADELQKEQAATVNLETGGEEATNKTTVAEPTSQVTEKPKSVVVENVKSPNAQARAEKCIKQSSNANITDTTPIKQNVGNNNMLWIGVVFIAVAFTGGFIIAKRKFSRK